MLWMEKGLEYQLSLIHKYYNVETSPHWGRKKLSAHGAITGLNYSSVSSASDLISSMMVFKVL